MPIKQLLKKNFPWLVILPSLILSGCQSLFSSHSNPSTIQEAITKKNGKVIYVAGTVTRTIPLLKNGAYQLQDDTGKIWIKTYTNLPTQGTKLSVKGKLQSETLEMSRAEIFIQEKERANPDN